VAPNDETREAHAGAAGPREGVGFVLRDRAAWAGGWAAWVGDLCETARERATLAADAVCRRIADAGRAEASIWRTFAARLPVTTTEEDLRALILETAARLGRAAPERVDLIVAGPGGADRRLGEAARAGGDAHALVLRHGGRDLALLRVPAAGGARARAEVRRRLEARVALGSVAWAALRGGAATGDGRNPMTPGRDDATGLPDAAAFERMVATALDKARQMRGKLAVLVVRPAGIEAIRDDDGSVFADAAVGLVARAVRATVRGSDPIARLGDDALAVLLPGASESNARRVAEAVMAAIAEAGQAASTAVPLTAVVGVAAYPGPATTVRTLIERARRAIGVDVEADALITASVG
jgi:diguanylate cyclase (GGDEF)-like protein